MHSKWHRITYTVHYSWPGSIGLWTKVVHYVGNRVSFGTHHGQSCCEYWGPRTVIITQLELQQSLFKWTWPPLNPAIWFQWCWWTLTTTSKIQSHTPETCDPYYLTNMVFHQAPLVCLMNWSTEKMYIYIYSGLQNYWHPWLAMHKQCLNKYKQYNYRDKLKIPTCEKYCTLLKFQWNQPK